VSRRFSVNLTTGADAVIKVELSDDELTAIAENLGVPVADLTLADLSETVLDKAHELAPSICAQCAGWSNDDVSLSLDDEWEATDEPPHVDLSWVSPAVARFFGERENLDVNAVRPLIDALLAAAGEHVRTQAARYPAVEEITHNRE